MEGQILVVDGTATSRITLKVRLAAACYDPLTARTGVEALGVLARCRPSMVLVGGPPGDMDAMLINLAIVRDVPGGKPLNYRMVENGKVSPQTWRVEGKEVIEVGGTSHQATKVSRTSGDKQMILWVVDSLPAPARVLQRKDGKDEMDLRLESVR